MRVAVIGGGIIGVSCATKILEYYRNSPNNNVEVVLITEELTPHTTGDGSAGLWGPFILANTDTRLIYKWAKSTHQFFERIWLSDECAEAGVCLLPCIRVSTAGATVQNFWHDIVYGCTSLTSQQLKVLNEQCNKDFNGGVQYMTFTAEPMKLLPYLMKKFQQNGGEIVVRKVNDLYKFVKESDFEVVCNCTGLGAKQLLQDDHMYPVRGQVTRVRANWVFYAFLDESDDGNYIIPNVDTVVLGGTHQAHDFNTIACREDKRFILNGCIDIIPALANATHLFDWVGLRPGRTAVRLEKLRIGKKLLIHNYGHGGSGVTLAWGCAEHVLDLLKYEFDKSSKL